jgi:L-iditol 2-dehydrogenase
MQLEKEAEGKITNEKAFQERCQSHREADEALKALGETKGKSLDEIKEILKFRNEVMFRLEELLLESERKPISSVKNLQPADIIFNIITKEVFEYGTGDRKIPDGDLAQYVTLAPLSISVEQRLLRNELVTRLYDQSADASQIHEAALLQLKAMERRGILPKPFEMLDTFQHCHTDHSYSVDLLPDGSVGYRTPSAFAWRAYQLGLLLSGQCDHDITNFDEFLNAAAILELRNPTCAYEQRVRPYGTEFMKMDINSPGNPGEIYMVVHSVSENGNEQLDMPDGVREAKIKRFKRNIRYLNALDLSDYLLLDYDKHIRSRTRVNNPTERHLAEAVAGRIYEKFTDNITYGKWEPVYAFVEELINKAVQPATPFALDDTGRSDIRNASDFTVFIRNNLVTPLKERFPPTKKECIDLTAFVDYAHSKGYLVYYPYLGDTKGCEAERRENVRKLFRLMKAAGVDGIAFMHNRNSDEELEGVLQIALEEGLKCRCNGMDVNKERMPFLYFDISCRKEYVDEAFRIYRGERERREPNEYRTTFHDEVTKRYHDHYASLIVRPGVVRPGQGVTTYEVPVLTDYMDPEKNKGKVKYVTMRQSEAPDGGVIVAIEYCAICGTDLNIWRGRRGRDQQMLERDIFIQGHEAVGRIVKVGKGIKDYKVGQRVVLQTIISDGNCSTCGKDLKSMCDERRAKSHQLPGYFSPEITFFPEDVKAGNLIPVSDEPKADHLSLTEPIACALYSLLRSKNPEIEALRGRQEKLVIWGTGFQGIVHAMLASLVDEVKYKKVILFGRNEAKNARARKILDSLGLYDVKIYNNKKLSTEEIDRICGDDTDTNVIAFSPQDGESAAELYLDIARHTRPGGAVNLYGGLDKDWPVIAPRMAHTRHIRFIGNSGAATEVLEKVARLIENKTIPPNALEQFITHRFPLSKTQEAFEAAGARDALKVVVRCSEHAKSQDGPQTKEAAFTCGGENVRATYTVSPGFGKTLTLDMQE